MEILDLEQNPWINDIPEDELSRVINRTLKLGHMVLSLSEISVNPLNTLFQPLKHDMKSLMQEGKNNMEQIGGRIQSNIDEIRNSVDYLTKSKNTSSLKGKLGEITIEKVLKNSFPDDTLINMSKSTAESDYHFVFDDNKIMIEIKTYSSNVPTAEIEKFKRDMKRNGCDNGIFISTTSGVTGHKRFEIEELDQRIIYIPNSGLEGGPLVWAILMLKNLIKYKFKSQLINKGQFKEIFEAFNQEYTNICKLKHELIKSKNTVEQIFDNLYLRTADIEVRLKYLIEDAEYKLSLELDNNYKIGDKKNIIEHLDKNKSKIKKNVLMLLDILENKNLKYVCNQDLTKWQVFKDNNIFGSVKMKKTKVDIELVKPHISVDCDTDGLKLLNSIL
jgi:hypothetical protein